MKYDIEYFETMLRINSPTAKEINAIRWNWVSEVHAKTILDFGSGIGFFRAFRNNGAAVDTFDLGPYCQTGMKRDHYDLVTMWDVLEHLETLDDARRVLEKTDNFACTVPVLPEGKDLILWKHRKPGEHVRIFYEGDVERFVKKEGFYLTKIGSPECPPRTDIMSFLFRRL